MYSMVLMAALTTGVATPDCHHRCGGCCGCYGGWGGCYGGGCYGGGCYGGGCYGGCYGGFGGCYGGGCYGGGCYGGGCYGGGYGCWGGYSSWGCAGCVGGYGGISYPGMIGPGVGGAVVPNAGGEQLPPAKPNKDGKETRVPNRAKLIVELPTDAKLFIDDMPMKTTSGVRTFNTPTLEPGQAYYYMVRIEYVKDGKTVRDERRVIVRAGQIARAEFKDRDADAVRTVQAK